jgi:hypothetical protein
MPQYNISTLWSALGLTREKPEYDKWIKDRAAMLDACSVDGVREAYNDTKSFAIMVFSVNIGAWVPYILPFLIIALLIDGYKQLSNQLQKMLLANEKQWSQNLSGSDADMGGFVFSV